MQFDLIFIYFFFYKVADLLFKLVIQRYVLRSTYSSDTVQLNAIPFKFIPMF